MTMLFYLLILTILGITWFWLSYFSLLSSWWLFNLFIFVFVIRYIIFVWYRKIIKKDQKSLKKLFFILSKRTFIYILILGTFITWFTYYNYNSDVYFNIHTLKSQKTNKEVVFIEMSHIANSNFYNNVNKKLKDFAEKDYTLFYEWVNIDVEWKDIENSMWIELTPETYSKFKSMFKWEDISSQDNKKIIDNFKEDKIKNSDIKYSELLWYEYWKEYLTNNKLPFNKIISEYIEVKANDLNKTEKENIKISSGTTIEKNNTSTEKLKEGIDNLSKEDTMLSYFITAYMKFLLKNPTFYEYNAKLAYSVLEFSQWKEFWNYETFFKEKIINHRNKVLAEDVFNSKQDKIVITYWKLHYTWFLEELKKLDDSFIEIKKEPIKVL